MSHHYYTQLSLEERIIIQNRLENSEIIQSIAEMLTHIIPGDEVEMKIPMASLGASYPRDFKNIRKTDILKIESLINNRPRKRLQWLTSLEYYKSHCYT